jgi:hypothetical protein
MVFSKRRCKLKTEFRYDGNVLEVVDHFKYLGVFFSFNGKFMHCKKQLYQQAQRAMFSVIKTSRSKELPIDVQLHLFDAMVLPILIYGCEIWRYENVANIDKLQLKLFRYILKLRNSTPICMIRAELGKLPIECEIKKRILNFWINLVDPAGTKLCNKIYSVLYGLHTSRSYSSPWIVHVESMLNNCGLGYIWQEQYTHGDNWLKEIFKQNIRDQFVQSWHIDVFNSRKCCTYRLFKHAFELEHYFQVLPLPKFIRLCKCCTSNHRLPIETGRHIGTPREERYCTFCNQRKLGDEFHCVLECPALQNKRSRYIDNVYTTRPNVLKLSNFFNSTNNVVLSKLVKYMYIQEALSV